jgi:pheromone shutdown protein TraB
MGRQRNSPCWMILQLLCHKSNRKTLRCEHRSITRSFASYKMSQQSVVAQNPQLLCAVGSYDAAARVNICTKKVDYHSVPSNLTHLSNVKCAENVYRETKTYSKEDTIPSWKASLPIPLRDRGPHRLQKVCISDNVDVYLLGTGHVLKETAADVQLLLSHINPDCIFLELCDDRFKSMFPQHSNNADDTTNEYGDWFLNTMAILQSMDQDYTAKQLDAEAGVDFISAVDYWSKNRAQNPCYNTNQVFVGNVNLRRRPYLILGDRPIQLTLARISESFSWWDKVKSCAGLLLFSLPWFRQSPEELRTWSDSVTRDDKCDGLTEDLEEMRQDSPAFYKAILSERDTWLAAKLIQTCRAICQKLEQQTEHQRQTMVAVVGASHVAGIVKQLTAQTNQTPEQVLSELVKTRKWAHDKEVHQITIQKWIHDLVEVPHRS